MPEVVSVKHLQQRVRNTHYSEYGTLAITSVKHLQGQVLNTLGRGYGIPTVMGTVYLWS